MREMLRTMLSSITAFFRAIEKGSETVENYAKWAEAESAAFEQEAKLERTARLSELTDKLRLVDANVA